MESETKTLFEDILVAQVIAIAESKRILKKLNNTSASLDISEAISEIRSNRVRILQDLKKEGLL